MLLNYPGLTSLGVKTFLTAVFLVFLSGCDGCNDDPKPKTELEKLPPATQSAKNTFGCLINGQAWYTVSSIDADAVYQQGNFTLQGSIKKPTQGITIILEDSQDAPLQEGKYTLVTSSPFSPSVSVLYSDECLYGFYFTGGEKDLLSGEMTFTKFDKSNYIVSGTFEFDIVTEGCDTLHVTDGRFDISYIP